MPSKVAIVGFASSSRDLAPFEDPSFEIWTLNHAHQFGYKWDRHFEIHQVSQLENNVIRQGETFEGSKHNQWLKSQPGPDDPKFRPIYMQKHFDEYPASVAWPRDQVNLFVNHLELGETLLADGKGLSTRDYWTSSISQMLAFAAMEGFQEIHLYGVDMLEQEEYHYQRSGLEYLVGLLRGSGYRVYIPDESALCKAGFVYGFEGDLAETGPLVEHIKRVANGEEKNKQQAVANTHAMQGALQLCDELAKKFEGNQELTALIAEKARVLSVNLKAAERAIHRLDGAVQGYSNCVAWAAHFGRGGKMPERVVTRTAPIVEE